MTSRELMAALAKRYDITNPNLENLPDSILLAIQHEEHNTLSYKRAVVSLAHQAQIILEPLDTFAARAHDAIRAKFPVTMDDVREVDALVDEIHALLPPGEERRLSPEHYTITQVLEDVRSFLCDFGQNSDLAAHLMAPALRDLTARYDVPKAPLDTLAKRLVAHLVQMEADAAEAHSAAKALGVEVKDLADRAKQLHQDSTRQEQGQRLIHVLAEQMANIRRRLAVPANESVMVHLDDLLAQRDLFQANAVDALDRLAKVEAKLQAINEALPADIRHSEDLAAAVRLLVLSAETRYYQWSELARDTAPAVQTVAALRYALESRSMRLALARELYDADDNLLELLETADAHQMTEALLATLATNRAAPEYPPLPKPSAIARTLEGPARIAYYDHSTRPGRIEAIGDDLIRFYPVEGDPVTLNATRRDLEVYTISADELATQIARTEARKAPPAETPSTPRPPDVADDDLPF